MTPELEANLRSYVSFPTPPGVATTIIEVAQDPNIEMSRVAQVVGMDPALTTKVLRIANSPLYAQRRRSENLRQALVVLGLNATLTLALSFSLVKALRGGKPNGINYPYYWRRALLGAMTARALGDAVGQTLLEELFLAGLLQDIGVLALDRCRPETYRGIGALQHNHRELQAHERKLLGTDHVEVGAWLMRNWNLSPRLCNAISQSHRTVNQRVIEPGEVFNCCVALSGPIADIFLLDAEQRPFLETALAVERSLGLDKEAFGALLATVSALVPETEKLFDAEILGGTDPDVIIEQAREILMVRSLQTLREASSLRNNADQLSTRALELEEETRRDALTGVYNRSYLGQVLNREFESASRHAWPISIAFAELDGFERVNESYGHAAGDRLLQGAARILRGNSRESDFVVRYGGEQFLIVLPATDSDTVRSICERIVAAFQHTRHDIDSTSIGVTVSIGHATHGPDATFASPEAFLKAADEALRAAKLRGRNRAVAHEAGHPAPSVQVL
jgi:diguanylate cyclase (GGDEF)-like protein